MFRKESHRKVTFQDSASSQFREIIENVYNQANLSTDEVTRLVEGQKLDVLINEFIAGNRSPLWEGCKIIFVPGSGFQKITYGPETCRQFGGCHFLANCPAWTTKKFEEYFFGTQEENVPFTFLNIYKLKEGNTSVTDTLNHLGDRTEISFFHFLYLLSSSTLSNSSDQARNLFQLLGWWNNDHVCNISHIRDKSGCLQPVYYWFQSDPSSGSGWNIGLFNPETQTAKDTIQIICKT